MAERSEEPTVERADLRLGVAAFHPEARWCLQALRRDWLGQTEALPDPVNPVDVFRADCRHRAEYDARDLPDRRTVRF